MKTSSYRQYLRYLISAAFQLELAHHLDTAQDRETAHHHSTQGALAMQHIELGSQISVPEPRAGLCNQYLAILAPSHPSKSPSLNHALACATAGPGRPGNTQGYPPTCEHLSLP